MFLIYAPLCDFQSFRHLAQVAIDLIPRLPGFPSGKLKCAFEFQSAGCSEINKPPMTRTTSSFRPLPFPLFGQEVSFSNATVMRECDIFGFI